MKKWNALKRSDVVQIWLPFIGCILVAYWVLRFVGHFVVFFNGGIHQ